MCWKCRMNWCRIRTLRFWGGGVLAKLALQLSLDILDDAEDLSICLEDFFFSRMFRRRYLSGYSY